LSHKILIVEDEIVVAQDIAKKLESVGYEITGIAASGRDAIQFAKNSPPDLILMDVRIKGELNGIETAIVIQGQLNRQLPVVFLTAFLSREFPYLKVVDPYVYLNKPFTERELLESIELAIKQLSGLQKLPGSIY
jgi:CheY-like chemotaxis protein